MFCAKFHVSRIKNVGLAPVLVERGPGAGGHVGFLNFEALIDIFELGIQQIWIQHPLIPLEMVYTKNKHKMPSGLCFSENRPCLPFHMQSFKGQLCFFSTKVHVLGCY